MNEYIEIGMNIISRKFKGINIINRLQILSTKNMKYEEESIQETIWSNDCKLD